MDQPAWLDDPERYAFWRVMNGLADTRVDPEEIYPVWRAGRDAGQPSLNPEMIAMLPDRLAWPILESWAEQFRSEQPIRWGNAFGRPGTRDQRLLISTLSRSAYGLGRLARRIRRFSDLRFGQRLPDTLAWRFQFMPDEPPAVQAVCRAGAEQLVAGNWSALPPFFPGDRTGWDIVRVL